MGNNSILVSKPNYFYQTTADEHVLICKSIQHKKAKSRANPFCMSKLLSNIVYWTDKKRSPENETQDLGVFFTLDQWHTLLRGEHSRQAIIDSLDAMVQEGYLTLRKEFRPGGGKPHSIYYLQADLVNKKISALPDIDPFDIFPKVTNTTKTKVTDGTTESQTKVTDVTNVSNKRDYAKSQTGLCIVTDGTTNLNYKSLTTNQETTNQSNVNAGANAGVSTHKNVSQETLFSSQEETEQEQEKKPKKQRSQKKQEQTALPELPDMEGPATIETILQLGNYLRQSVYVANTTKAKRALQEGANPLANKRRPNLGKTGYSLQEIAKTWRFMIGETPEGKPWLKAEWWSEPQNKGHVDLWAIAKHIDAMLAQMEELERQNTGAPARSKEINGETASGRELTTMTGNRYKVRVDLVLWTRLAADDERLIKHLDYTLPQADWDINKVEIPWEWMTKQEAIEQNNGWEDGQRFTDYQLQQLINAVYRAKGIDIEHHVQQYIDAEKDVA